MVSAKDNAGNDMMYAYEQYFAAQNGRDLTLTLDATIQYYLEKGLENMADKFAAPPTAPQASSWTSTPAASWPWPPTPTMT